MSEPRRRVSSTTKRAVSDPWADAVIHLRESDARWIPVLDRVGPCLLRPVPAERRFEILVRSIVSQQISTRAAASIQARLCEMQGGTHHPETLLRLSADELRGAGVSAAKARSLQELGQHVASGAIPLRRIDRMTDEEIIIRLTEVRGIGRWTAEMFLVFALNRPDVLSAGDLGIRDGIRNHYALPNRPAPRLCEELAEPWRPYRTVAMWYLWRSRDTSPPRKPTPGG